MAAVEVDDLEGLAAEYALGTLDEAEMTISRSLVRSDASFARQVSRWHRRLDPLLDQYPPSIPPKDALANILDQLEASEVTPTATVHIFEHRVRFWKRATAGAMALAASLLAFVAVRESSRMSNGNFVAVLETSTREPAFVAVVDTEKRTLALRRIAPAPKPGRSYELWAIAGANAPKSLGLVDLDANLLRDSRGKALDGPDKYAGITLAVTVEAAGGSPTGQPTTTPIFTGTLLEAPKPR